jgi:hypothetical protein
MSQLTKLRAEQLIRAMCDRRIVVLGDVMLDEFVWGDVTRISPEAPVPVVDIRRESVHLGGAANVLANIVALGAQEVNRNHREQDCEKPAGNGYGERKQEKAAAGKKNDTGEYDSINASRSTEGGIIMVAMDP